MDDARSARHALEQLGLTEYEARCFVALTRIPHGTAKEVAQVADVPRSRVYEVAEQLQQRGLVAMEEAEPRQFQSVSVDSAIRILRKEYDGYFETAEQSLRQLEPVYEETKSAVWAMETHEQVTGQVLELIESTDDEIVYIVLQAGLLDEDVLDALVEASDRGVGIHVGTCDDEVKTRISDADVEATLFSTGLIEWFTAMTETPRIGRLLMTDRGPVLASALHEEELPGVHNETAA